ncbi:hypothetical protein BwSH14_03170 [Bradyrhizobium ottawaense]|nr:hypothetical protein BwSH14_03170 [Bradyrhizobium ottawaense]GMO70870.1 hypothetical protein BwSH17_28090 [Bradyrhizobium ottawaense]
MAWRIIVTAWLVLLFDPAVTPIEFTLMGRSLSPVTCAPDLDDPKEVAACDRIGAADSRCHHEFLLDLCSGALMQTSETMRMPWETVELCLAREGRIGVGWILGRAPRGAVDMSFRPTTLALSNTVET